MHLVKIDVIGLHALERGIAGATNVEGREFSLVWPVAHVAVQLGGKNSSLPPSTVLRKPGSDDFLCAATVLTPPVHVGSVEKIDAVSVGRIHDRVRVRLVRLRSKVHGA